MIRLWQIASNGWISPMVSSSLSPKTRRNLQSCGEKERETARSWHIRKWPEHWGITEEQVKSLKFEGSWHTSSVLWFYRDLLHLTSWEKKQFIIHTFSLVKNISVQMTGSVTIITCITMVMRCSTLTARHIFHTNRPLLASNSFQHRNSSLYIAFPLIYHTNTWRGGF